MKHSSSELRVIGTPIFSTPIFFTLQCIPNLTLLVVQLPLSSDNLGSFDYPPVNGYPIIRNIWSGSTRRQLHPANLEPENRKELLIKEKNIDRFNNMCLAYSVHYSVVKHFRRKSDFTEFRI